MLNESEDAIPRGVSLVLVVGFILVFVGVLVVVAGSLLGSDGSASVGGVVFVGPFPIVFGAGPDAAWLILVGIIIAVVSMVMFWVLRRKLSWVVVD